MNATRDSVGWSVLCLSLAFGCHDQSAIDRQWAIDQADLAECVVPQQTEKLSWLLTTEWGAQAVFNAGRTAQAAEWAQQLLDVARGHEDNPDYGGAIHGGNIILGRIALQRGDVETAKQRLLAAGNTPGSPVLCSFGPSMLLARDLLALGEKETVLAYLDECQWFWNRPRHMEKLREWRNAIANDEVPDFGASLTS